MIGMKQYDPRKMIRVVSRVTIAAANKVDEYFGP